MSDTIRITTPKNNELVCEYANVQDSNTTILICKPAPQTPVDTYVPPQENSSRVCDQHANFDPCKPYTGCAEIVPMIACGSTPASKSNR